MTTFEIAKTILQIITNSASEVMSYVGWSDEFAAGYLRRIPENVRKYDWFQPINPGDLSVEEMEQLGFRLWSKESGMMLIPLWLHPFLSDMIMCGCIDDTTPVMRARKDIDNDNRAGCLAYGVVKKTD